MTKEEMQERLAQQQQMEVQKDWNLGARLGESGTSIFKSQHRRINIYENKKGKLYAICEECGKVVCLNGWFNGLHICKGEDEKQ